MRQAARRHRRAGGQEQGGAAEGSETELDAYANVLRDPARAEDAVQEALLKAWRDLPRLREAAARLLAERDVADLTVEDPPIEDVIELVFAQERA